MHIKSELIVYGKLLVREKQLLELLPFKRCALWAAVRRGEFPKPYRVSGGITAWKSKDVEAWVENLKPEEVEAGFNDGK